MARVGLVEAELARARRAARGSVAEMPHRRTRRPLRGSIGDLRRAARSRCARARRRRWSRESSVVRRVIRRKSSYLMIEHDGARAQLGRAQPRARRDRPGRAASPRARPCRRRRRRTSPRGRPRPGRRRRSTVARILAARERREVLAVVVAEPADERRLGIARDVADRREAHASRAPRASPRRRPTAASPAAGAGTRAAGRASTTRRPSGLSMSEAIFAASLIGATPTDATSAARRARAA